MNTLDYKMNITQKNWALGWTPSADNSNGDPNGLLRMDNLQQEETGAIGLARGGTTLTTAGAKIVKIHSRSQNGYDYLWYGTENGQQVKQIRSDGNVSFAGDIITAGGTRPVITDVFSWIYALSGNQRKKFNGSATYNLGFDTPTLAPVVAGASQGTKELIATAIGWSLLEGQSPTIDPNGIKAYPDSTTARGSVALTYAVPADFLTIGSAISTSPENDTFQFNLQLGDSADYWKARVEFLMDANGDNYYWYEWDLSSNTALNPGVDQWTTLKTTRGRFIRQGNTLDAAWPLGWKNIVAVRFKIDAANDNSFFQIRDPKYFGGSLGNLYGAYQYVYIYAKDNGQYISKGPSSPVSNVVEVLNGTVYVSTLPPGDNAEFPEAWIFRRSVPAPFLYYDSFRGESVQLPQLLDQFYLVATTTPGATVVDSMSDVDALKQNITLNQFLLQVKAIPEPITDVLGMYFERALYLTKDKLYISDRLNPEVIDTRYTVKVTSSLIDTNLWLKKVNNSTLLLGNTQDLFELSGTFLDLPDGTLDLTVRPLGEKYPPICYDVASAGGILFYVGANGVRTTNGSSSQLLSPQLSLLFQKLTRHNLQAINITSGALLDYPIAVAHNKLWVGVPFLDGVRRLLTYDFLTQSWQLRSDAVSAAIGTDSDKVFLGTNTVLAEFENTATFTSSARNIVLQTVADSNNQPRNRKEPFTLKLTGDTGNTACLVEIAVDNGTFITLGNFTSNGITTKFFDLSSIAKGFRYALRISGTVTTFKLIEYTLEYDALPEQLNYLHIQNTNMGTTARKRIGQFAIVIDTFGQTVAFTPVVDGVSYTPINFNTTGRTTQIFQFLTETIGIDIGGFLESASANNPFEFFGPALDKCAYEVLPGAYDYLLLSPDNYGTPNRKAFTSIKFRLDTYGNTVRFTPYLDGVWLAPADYVSTPNRPITCEYFFDTALGDVTAIDIGGELKNISRSQPTSCGVEVGRNVGFEYYGPLQLQNLEVFPPRLKSYYIRETNFDIAAKKRLRTIPMMINTNSSGVEFTPYLDGVAGASTVLSTPKKKTTYHYFKTDVFATDLAGFLSASTPFEFYGFGKLESVEVIPVGKKYDQVGPVRLDKIGKLFRLRLRIIATGTTLPITFYGEESENIPDYSAAVYAVDLPTTPNVDKIYELDLPKNLNSSIFRMTIGPTDDVFHRYDCLVQAALSGMETDKQWVPLNENS